MNVELGSCHRIQLTWWKTKNIITPSLLFCDRYYVRKIGLFPMEFLIIIQVFACLLNTIASRQIVCIVLIIIPPFVFHDGDFLDTAVLIWAFLVLATRVRITIQWMRAENRWGRLVLISNILLETCRYSIAFQISESLFCDTMGYDYPLPSVINAHFIKRSQELEVCGNRTYVQHMYMFR